MITRLLSSVLKESRKSILLLGPRQVGKSTLIESLKPDLIFNLNDDQVFLRFKSNAGELREVLNKSHRTVFIDEIQRHPTLLNTLQTIMDSSEFKGKIKFYISGSSARKLKRGHANLLPGRLFTYELGPLCAAELGYQLDCKKAMLYGCLPEVYLEKEIKFIEKLLSSYSGTYLKEEIQAEALTRNLEGYSRFIFAAAEFSGHILDFSKLAKLAKIERKLCSRFYEILEDTLLAQQVSVFDKTTADIVKRPKFYFFDNGVLNGLLNGFALSSDRKGVLFEQLVANQIAASAKARDVNYKLYYFRTRAGLEVDFVLEIHGRTVAIEVKTGTVNAQDLKSLKKFQEIYKKLDQLYVVTLEANERTIEGVSILDLNRFLKRIGL